MHYTFLLRNSLSKKFVLEVFLVDNVIDVITYNAQPYNSSSLLKRVAFINGVDKSSLSLSAFKFTHAFAQ